MQRLAAARRTRPGQVFRRVAPDDLALLPRDAQDLGNILLTYAMLWAYLAFMQLLVIWAEDLPAEIGWYVARATPLCTVTTSSFQSCGL